MRVISFLRFEVQYHPIFRFGTAVERHEPGLVISQASIVVVGIADDHRAPHTVRIQKAEMALFACLQICLSNGPFITFYYNIIISVHPS